MARLSQEKASLRQLGAQQFNSTLKSQTAWRLRANQLLCAARVLRDTSWEARQQRDELLKHQSQLEVVAGSQESETVTRSQLFEEASLLLAFAFENLFKALWVGQNYEAIQKVENLPKPLKSHELRSLAEKTNISLEDDEKAALEILTSYAVWRGKYNLPKSKSENAEFWVSKPNVAFIMKKYPDDADWPDEIHSLLAKVLDKLNQISEDRKF